MHTAKGEMINLINRLQAQDQLTDRILKAIASDQSAEEVVQQLREGRTYESIVGGIAAASLPGSGENEIAAIPDGLIPVEPSNEVGSLQLSNSPDEIRLNTIRPFKIGKNYGFRGFEAEPRVNLWGTTSLCSRKCCHSSGVRSSRSVGTSNRDTSSRI